MKIKLTSVLVDDQAKALAFYTDILGFTKKHDIPMGGDARWLTLTPPEGHDDVELLRTRTAGPRTAGRRPQQQATGELSLSENTVKTPSRQPVRQARGRPPDRSPRGGAAAAAVALARCPVDSYDNVIPNAVRNLL
jgi:catechol 2,3-dioxygenase-like lactoylglutathione lyase family enzyme